MREITLNLCNKDPLVIGVRGENGAAAVLFDFSAWVESYGAGVVQLYVKRYREDNAYPVVLTTDGNVARWTVSNVDTDIAGAGQAEFVYTVDGTVVKTAIINTFVLADLGQPVGPAPDPYENWFEELTQLAAETQQNALDAENAAERAETAAEGAGTAADDALDAAERAETAASMLENVSAEASTLPEGSSATASYSNGVFSFGIPKGDRGDTGPQGPAGPTGPTGADGITPTVEVTDISGGHNVAFSYGEGDPRNTDFDVMDGEVSLEDLAELAESKADVIIDTATGNPVTIPDGADNMLFRSIEAEFEPIQDLNGYSNPWPAGGGNNKLPDVSRTATVYGVTATYSGNHISLRGTANGSGGRTYLRSEYFQLKAGTYYLQRFNVTGNAPAGLFVQDGTTILNGTPFTVANDSTSINIGANVSNGVDYDYEADITISPVLLDAYEPHENLCPISGWEGIEINHTGENLLNISQTTEAFKGGSALYTLEYGADNSVTMRTSTAGSLTAVWESFVATAGHVGKKIYGTRQSGSPAFGPVKSDSIGGWINSGTSIGDGYIIQTADIGRPFGFRLYNRTGQDVTVTKAMMNFGSALLPYEPYTGENIPITWQDEAGTLYGGKLVINEDGSVDVIGDFAEADYSNKVFNLYAGFQDSANGKAGIMIGGYSQFKQLDTTGKFSIGVLTASSAYEQGKTRAMFYSNNIYIQVLNQEVANMMADTTDPYHTDVRQWFIDNGVQIVGKLATPVTYHLPNITALKTFLAANNVWTNANGDVTIKYPADTKLYIDKKIAAAVAALS